MLKHTELAISTQAATVVLTLGSLEKDNHFNPDCRHRPHRGLRQPPAGAGAQLEPSCACLDGETHSSVYRAPLPSLEDCHGSATKTAASDSILGQPEGRLRSAREPDLRNPARRPGRRHRALCRSASPSAPAATGTSRRCAPRRMRAPAQHRRSCRRAEASAMQRGQPVVTQGGLTRLRRRRHATATAMSWSRWSA